MFARSPPQRIASMRSIEVTPPLGGVFWLEQAMEADQGAACPPLAGNVRTDVCIVGGGYTGLWTAIELKRLAPDLSVTLIEADGCGFGASGRNGGWATSWFDELDRLIERFGLADGLALADRSSASVQHIGEFTASEGIECDFRAKGSLWVATSHAQESAIQQVAATCRDHGRSNLVTNIDNEEARRITGSPVARSGLLITDGAAVQPALLARGLRRAALRAGVKIHEGTPMLALERTAPVRVRTSAGTIEADQVVLATNVWSARIRELRRSVFIVAAQMILTEPLGDRLGDADWSDGLLFGDARMFVHFAQVTRDRRIAFGRGGGAISAAGRVIPKHTIDPSTVSTVVEDFRKWFPAFSDVGITHAWGGGRSIALLDISHLSGRLETTVMSTTDWASRATASGPAT